ncbi:hypothetical protein [Aquabacterium sp.]|uniref:hypothetical protein n=1 Tax=Aquabacterium sp. TaxID=1872578 RepID=UPI002BC807DB|nr:hypothetical protein [Aquabacterium sp.]HSW08014.1 hypothetical protein [Aquabacterium sp.]
MTLSQWQGLVWFSLPWSASLFIVKSVRTWLLLVLVVLLPIRGAVAAAMLCPAGSAGTSSELRMHEHALVGEAMDRGTAHHDHAGHHAEQSGAGHHHDGQDSKASDKCNMCSAFCSLTPMASEAPKLPEPLALADVKFAVLATPAPSFVSDGQERPPRTI